MGLMSQAVSRTQILVLARTKTRQQGLLLYIGDKVVNVAARPAKASPAEAGGLSSLNLPLISITHVTQMPNGQLKPGKFYEQVAYIQPRIRTGEGKTKLSRILR